MIQLTEKYERNGWPALPRPDLKPPAGWSLSLITSVNRIHHHRLSPDGRHLAFIWERDGLADVYVMPSAGGWPWRVSTERAAIPYWWDAAPQWSADSQWLAFAMNSHVYVAPTNGGLPQKISHYFPAASSPIWLPDSNGLIISVERDDTTKLILTDRDGVTLRTLTSGPGDDWDAQPAPDGRLLTFTHRPHDNLNLWYLRLLNLETGELTSVGNPKSASQKPKSKSWFARWSPDGNWLAFLSQESGFNEVWLVRPDGEGLHRLTHLEMDVSDLAWSPDGNRLACIVNRAGSFNLVLVDVESGDLSNLAGGHSYFSAPQWSPAGDFLTVEYEKPTRPPDLYRVALPDGRLTQLTFSNPPARGRRPRPIPGPVRDTSYDGLEIPAFLYRPLQPNGAAILYPHGGPTDQYVYYWDILAQYFVAKGYTYLAPNFRGSTGYGVAYEQANYHNWGVGDTQDCLHGADFLRALPGIDPERIAIYGGSYGGLMVACCLARDPQYRFACGVAKYGEANVLTSWAQCERYTRLYTEMQLGRPAANRQVYHDASPIHQIDNVRKPVLILHGLLDDVVAPQTSEEWAEALRRAGKTFEYKTYAGEPHGFLKRETQLDAFGRIERFLDWYLLPG
jgi:dipeptidyl aminopeptidase/acylaminoacyl peptidase